MTERVYHVTLKRGVDAEEFCHELEHDTSSTDCGCMVDRPVEYDDRRPNSLRTTDYVLTEAEAEALRSDPRVVAVELPLPDDAMAVDAIQTGDFSRGPGDSEIRAELLDWAKRRCSAAGIADNLTTSGAIGTSDSFITDHAYNIDGTGVDVVIQDDGVMTNHPEW